MSQEVGGEFQRWFIKVEEDFEFAVDYRYPDDSYIPELEEIITYKELILNIKMMIESKIINLEK